MRSAAAPASTRVALAASVLWRALVILAGLHVYWLLGGTWAVHAASGGAYGDVTPALRVSSAVVASLLVLGCLVVRARAGLWTAPVSDRIVRIAMWVLTACLAFAALLNFAAATNVERFLIAPGVLALALLALVVARSGRERHGSRHPQPSAAVVRSRPERFSIAPKAAAASRRVRLAALALIAGLVAGPLATHVYWMLGGTWGLYTRGVRDEVATTGTRVVAAVVVLLLVFAVLVVLARVGWWRQAFVSDRMIRLFAWALAGVFLLETLAAFTWSRGEELWWMYAPVSLVIAVLALVVAGSGGAWPRVHRPHRMLTSH